MAELLRRTVRESWEDAVFGQGGRMAFYHFLALFPLLLLFVAVGVRVPEFGHTATNALQDLAHQVLPAEAAGLLQNTMNELNQRALSGMQLASAIASALWAIFNGTWAMVYGLNKAYEVEEHRPWWKLAITIAGLTLSMTATGSIAVFFIFFGIRMQSQFLPGIVGLRAVQWVILSAVLLLSFAILYRFAPNLRDHKWRWSTPGALCALLLWIGATLGARLYFDHVNNYSRSYGHLNSVVMILLWLYLSNGSILIGGEMNSEIEKAVEQAAASARPTDKKDRSGC